MRLEFEIDLNAELDSDKNDGQIKTNLPKDYEMKFKMLNIKTAKKMSREMRRFAMTLIDFVDQQNRSA